jgi:membrane protease YdiL (CAAX protease family)
MVKMIKERGSFRDPLYCLLIFIAVTAAVVLVHHLGIPFGSVLIPALWGMGAVLPLRAADTDQLSLGFTSLQFIKGLKYFILSSAVIFPLYSGAFYASLHLGFTVPAGLIAPGSSVFNWVIYNFIAVAFFEELFFRGFVHGRFENFAKARFLNKKAVFWIPILVSAFLFALAHVAVDLDPARMAVFFPGLLFGWLRARTGTLLAPILSHGTANLLSMLLIRSVS